MIIKSKNKTTLLKICGMALTMLLLLVSCGGEAGSGGAVSDGNADAGDIFAGRAASDLSGYEGMEGYDKEIMLVDTTMREVDELMKDKETFVVLFSFDTCPWCNLLISHLNDAAIDAGVHVGYIDTRSNPEWSSNIDIDDYDKVIDRFGDWLEEDADGIPHLYTPDIYFIKDGKVVARHDGVTPGVEDASDGMTSKQEKTLVRTLKEEFATIK